MTKPFSRAFRTATVAVLACTAVSGVSHAAVTIAERSALAARTSVVSDVASLNSALKTAKAGDTILLAPGSYAGVSSKYLKIGGAGVTITSRDAGRPATITSLAISKSSGLNFKGLTFYVDPARGDNPFSVASSSNISFSKLDVHGTLNKNPRDDRAAFLIRTSSNVSVTDSQFYQLSNGVGHLNDDHLVISGNSFHDIQTDAIRGGGSSNVLVKSNSFTDFYPVGGDHPDAIQFWTRNTTTSAHDIVVEGNMIVRGAGAPVQGIFFRDQTNVTPYLNVTVRDNIVVGGGYNGIAIGGTIGLTLTGNTVAAFEGQNSWIRLATDDKVTSIGNRASIFITEASVEGIRQSGNVTIPTSKAYALAQLAAWVKSHGGLASAPTTPLPNPQNLVTLRRSPSLEILTGAALARSHAGRPVVGETAAPPRALPLATPSAVPEPSTWAMLIGGFAAIGFMIRRRRSTLPASMEPSA